MAESVHLQSLPEFDSGEGPPLQLYLPVANGVLPEDPFLGVAVQELNPQLLFLGLNFNLTIDIDGVDPALLYVRKALFETLESILPFLLVLLHLDCLLGNTIFVLERTEVHEVAPQTLLFLRADPPLKLLSFLLTSKQLGVLKAPL